MVSPGVVKMSITLRIVHLIVTVYVYLHRALQYERKKFQLSCLKLERTLGVKKERGRKRKGVFLTLKKKEQLTSLLFCPLVLHVNISVCETLAWSSSPNGIYQY